MNGKNMVDVSSFFLFEATGDSEAGVSDPGMPVVNHSGEDDGDEDAGSCICDGSDIPMVNKIYGDDHALRGGDEEEEDEEEEEEEEEEENGEVVEQEEVQGCQKWRSDQRMRSPEEQKSTVSVDSKKTKNERERSRLFWETCLAS